VLYRASADLSRNDSASFGVGVAAGAGAEQRALAEGIERFCMLHPPVAIRSSAARDLPSAACSAEAIRSLLFVDSAYAQPGFRFVSFDESTELSWSDARRLSDGQLGLVPTTLVGRPPASSRRLVDATSNGYAAHLDRSLAVEHAILELIERDALLLSWFAGNRIARVRDAPERKGAATYLVSTDVNLPVVLLSVDSPRGGLRFGSAAGPTFEEACERAARELEMVASAEPQPRPVDLDDPSARIRPSDHAAHYADPMHRGPLDAYFASASQIGVDQLYARWPAAGGSRPSRTLEALADSGLEAWIVDASRPELFGDWHVVRALIPGLVEAAWGNAYQRIASSRAQRVLAGRPVNTAPHPFG
jgi:ribosomal protein S12 methylthiotransferase accessory factor